MSTNNGLNPSFKPNSNVELARRAPAIDTLPQILMPRRGRPLPPYLHCGYPVDGEHLQELATTKFGYTQETATHGFSYAGMLHCFEKEIGHTAKYKLVYCEGKVLGLFSVCNNFLRSPRLAEVESKLKQVLEVEGPMKWYLDYQQWHWDSICVF